MGTRVLVRAWPRTVVGVVMVGLIVAACGTASPTASPSPIPVAVDPFAGLAYHIELPDDWMTTADDDYDYAFEAGDEMQGWLTALGLMEPQSFRAYEPTAGGNGLRIAISPAATPSDGLSPDLIGGAVTAEEEPIGDMVPIGTEAKAGRTRWAQALDWGDGTPSIRACVAYAVWSAYDPVNVVFTYPADGPDRLADVEAMMSTFEVRGNPVVSLSPGITPTPSPTPYDKFASQAPIPPSHDAPELEELLPTEVGGILLEVESYRGDEAGYPADHPILVQFGKEPADLAFAQALGRAADGVLILRVQKIDGVPGDEVLRAEIDAAPESVVEEVTVAGVQVKLLSGGQQWWPFYAWGHGELLYQVAFTDADLAAQAVAALS